MKLIPIYEENVGISALPDYLQKAIRQVLTKHPEYKDAKGCDGKCIYASDNLLFTCDDLLDGDPNDSDTLCDGILAGTQNYKGTGKPHHWAEIEGYGVDLTARQFDKNEPCPKIWKL